MFGKRKKNEIPPDTVQQTIPFDRMWKDGVCMAVGEPVLYTQTEKMDQITGGKITE